MSRYRQLFFVILVLCAVAGYIVGTMRIHRGLDLAGGMRIVYEARPGEGQKWDPSMRGTIANILENRVNASGVVEPVVQPKGENQFIVEIPDIQDKEELAARLAEPASLEFRHFRTVQSDANPDAPYKLELTDDGGYEFYDEDGEEVPAEQIIKNSPLILTGADLRNNARGDIRGMSPVVIVEFNPDGRRKFAQFTRRNVGDLLAIVFNDKILSVPRINEAILQGSAEISGMKDAKEAQQLANDLNAGALPVPLEIVEQNVVEASLGNQYVSQSIKAGATGIALVAAFMIIYYLLPGVLAVIALAMYGLFTFAIFMLMGVTMTLPGLAGFILSVGMAVDANILIFERLKEELRSGKTLHSAIDAGFKRAWTAILDSNVCTLITCLILIALTSGPVVGFAKTLGIGVLVSMFTAITVSRTLLHLVSNTGFGQNARFYGLGKQWMQPATGKGLDIIGRRGIFFAFSGILIALCLFFLLTMGLRPGIDFTGGTMVQVSVPNSVTGSQIREALGEFSPQVQLSPEAGKPTNTAFIRTRELNAEQREDLQQTITTGIEGARFESASFVGPSISGEITRKAVWAVILASLTIAIYLTFRFAHGGFAEGLKFGGSALAALIHDIIVVLGLSALFGRLFGWEIDGAYVTAVLTVIGYSVHDTIVIFDRIRENQKLRLKGETFEQLANRSILQSFARSINTSLTVVFVLVTLLIFGGSVIRHFNAVLLVGIVIGTYSSIFSATPILVVWELMARKQHGQLSKAEMKPLVEKPMASPGDPVIGPDNGDEEDSADITGGASRTGAPRAKSGQKRRKRRF